MSAPYADTTAEAYYPPPADWHFAAPAVLAQYDAGGAAAGSPLGRANFLRSAEWSPDGTALLTTAEDRTLRIFDLPWESLSPLLTPSLEIALQAPLYSALWHPYAHRAEPGSYCFLQACDGMPVKLVNAGTGALQGSYAIIDHQERFVAPHSMAFTPDLTQLYCGFHSALEIFTLALPGAEGSRIKTTASKAAKGGLKGLVSALAVSPDGGGGYVLGTYTGQVGVYDGAHRLLCVLKGVVGRGVTQIEYHPLNPSIIYLSSRRSPHLAQAFDLSSPKRPLANFPRPAHDRGARGSNQKGRFGLDRWGRYLVVGDEDGCARFYDVARDADGGDEGGRGREGKGVPVQEREAGFVLKAGEDTISTVAVHPYLPIIATVSGARPVPTSSHSSSSSSSSSDSAASSSTSTSTSTTSDDDDDDDGDPSASAARCDPAAQHRRRLPEPREAQLRVWSFAAPAAAGGRGRDERQARRDAQPPALEGGEDGVLSSASALAHEGLESAQAQEDEEAELNA